MLNFVLLRNKEHRELTIDGEIGPPQPLKALIAVLAPVASEAGDDLIGQETA